jgi:hypothetical protein
MGECCTVEIASPPEAARVSISNFSRFRMPIGTVVGAYQKLRRTRPYQRLFQYDEIPGSGTDDGDHPPSGLISAMVGMHSPVTMAFKLTD